MKFRFLIFLIISSTSIGVAFTQERQDPDVAEAPKSKIQKDDFQKSDTEQEKIANSTDSENFEDIAADPKSLKRFLFQLRKRIGKDQKTRIAIIRYRQRTKTIDPEKLKSLFKKASDIDGDNLKWAKSHVQQYGWPTISTIGSRQADEFFTIVQHADRDSNFQKKCLKLMSKLPEAEWSKSNYGKLAYRIKVLEGKYENMPLPNTPIPKSYGLRGYSKKSR